MIGPVANPHIDLRREPHDIGFNAAVMTLANRCLPMGWHVEPNYHAAPKSLLELNATVNLRGMTVWGGCSNYTIFGDAEHNYAFRAWHDSVHYRHQMPYDLSGEAAVAFVQCWQLFQNYGDDTEVTEWAALILTEVIGQCLYEAQTGEFPLDQRAFDLDNVGQWRRLAARLAIELSDDNVTERQALELAFGVFGKPA